MGGQVRAQGRAAAEGRVAGRPVGQKAHLEWRGCGRRVAGAPLATAGLSPGAFGGQLFLEQPRGRPFHASFSVPNALVVPPRSTGLLCHLSDACISNPCNEGSNCDTNPVTGKAICTCPIGYTGPDCNQDVNECSLGKPAGVSGRLGVRQGSGPRS